MIRVVFLCCVALAAACGNKSFQSLCANQVPAPSACNTPCDPAPGATLTCIAGYHCTSAGKCDIQCTPDGNQCGKGYSCTADGFCISGSGGGSDIVDSGTGGIDAIDAACPAVHFKATHTTPSIQLLIDKSASMAHDFADTDQVTATNPAKYPTEQDALVGDKGIVTQLQSAVYFGASMFPADACPGLFTVGRALNNVTQISMLFDDHAPQGNTPTAESINLVVQDFIDHPAPMGSPPVILLATDGLPNTCDDTSVTQAAEDAAVTAASNAFSHGIRLFLLVVGNKIDAAFEKRLANAGQGVATGQPDAMAYNATDPQSLSAAFQSIIGGVLSCDLALNGMVSASDASTGVVVLDGVTLTYMTDWTLDPNGTIIHLLGNACNTLKTADSPTVDVTFDCGGAVIFF